MRKREKLRQLIKLVMCTPGIVFEMVSIVVRREMLARRQLEMRTHALARQEAQYRMNEFLSTAGHELKTPLTSIKGNVQLLVRRLKMAMSTEGTHREVLIEAQELLERTDQQITRLTRLVSTLLDSSRIQAHSLDLFLELCEMGTLIKDVVQDQRYIPSLRQIIVEQPKEKSIFVMADANRIRQVIIHYLTNAHKYSPPDRPIVLQVQEEEHFVRVLVRDEGPGIALNEQKKIWDCFYRVPTIATHNTIEGGLGLGLYVSKNIIEQHHGQVGVQSTPGHGSIFWFTLPAAHHIIHTELPGDGCH
jgi:signal transduction histidine kinase